LDNNEIEDISTKIKQADAVLVTAANGFSISEGFNLFANNQSFKDTFRDFQARYGVQSIFQGMNFFVF